MVTPPDIAKSAGNPLRRIARPIWTARPIWVGVFVLVLCCAAFAGYQQVFSSFASYDDEGYVMMSLRSFMGGRPLYDETYSQYGPAFYCYGALLHGTAQLPLTHDAIRLKTLLIWLTVALLGAALVYRFTGLRWLALVTLVLGFFHLERLSLEPGHPQELCLLVVTACLLVTSYFETVRRRVACVAVCGILTGVALATKVNVGVFLALAMIVALLLPVRHGRWGRWLLWLVVASGLLLPFLLIGNRLLSAGGFLLAFVTCVSLLSVVLVARRNQSESPQAEDNRRLDDWGLGSVIVFGAATAVTFAIFCLVCWLHGTSLHGIFHGLVGQHRGAAKFFYVDVPLSVWVVPWSLVCLLAALSRSNQAGGWLLGGLVSLAAIRHLCETWMPLEHGLMDRGAAAMLVGFGTPLVWLLLRAPQSLDRSQDYRFPVARLALCLVAVLQPLGAFPIPGTQMAAGSFAILLVCLVVLADWLRASAAHPASDPTAIPASRPAWHGPLIGSLLTLSLLTLVVRGVHGWHVRRDMVPLGLPGASRLRLPQEQVAQAQWLSGVLREHGDTFVGVYEAKNSFYFWSGLMPPTALNANYWPGLLSDGQQQKIARALDRFARPCVVWDGNDRLVPARRTPLADYVTERFEPIARRGDLEVWVRKRGLQNSGL